MANEEHLSILQQGVEAWNSWRRDNPDIRPDLIRAYLFEANLSGAYLSEAILTTANLSGADLSRTDLSEANLAGANLSGANLSGADLFGANLSGANLRRADLSEADLRRANLSRAYLLRANLNWADLSEAYIFEADLSGADLRGADLIDAYLSEAYIFEADLSGADLSGAILVKADLRGVNLSGALLRGAYLIEADLIGANLSVADAGWTVFGNVDLSVAKGLDTVRHGGPSTIGIDTIYRSRGNIPDVFLRGAGVPDSFIEYIASLVGRPIQFYSCFISYSSKDQDAADRLHADLQSKGIRCWFAPEDMKIGDRIRQRIDEAIRLYDKLLLILSEHSMDSDWVEKEVETAFEEERRRKRTVLFPIRLDDLVMETDQAWAADIRRTRHIGDFRRWKDHDAYQEAFARLVRDLEREES